MVEKLRMIGLTPLTLPVRTVFRLQVELPI